jgi:hypothetical protein
VTGAARVGLLLLAGPCCLAGFALRAHGLGNQSLWLDEGASYAFALLSPGALVARTFSSEPNPPLYYLLLHGWVGGAGTSEYALRYLSLLPGVLTVALTYRLGLALVGRPAAVAAALLTAANPYLIWYAQEARMYALLGCLATATLLAVHRAAQRPTRPAWAIFGLLLLATLYSHFYGLFVLLVCGLYLLVAWPDRALRRAEAALALIIPFLLYLPWLVAVLQHGDHGGWRTPAGFAQIADGSAVAFVNNGFLSGSPGHGLVIIEVVLAAAGIALTARFGRGVRAAALLPAAIVAPALAVAAASRHEPIFGANYIIGQAPVFLVAVAAGVTLALRWLWLSIPGALVLAGYSLFALHQGWQDPRFANEDFRDAVRYLSRAAAPGDVIVLAAEYARLPFDYYYHGPAVQAPFTGNPAQPGAFLQPLAEQHRMLWLVLSHAEQIDPKGQIRAWLDGNYPLATEQFPKGIQIFGYRTAYRLTALPTDVTVLHQQFSGGIELAGYTAQNSIPPTDRIFHPPSNWLHVVLYWRAATTPSAADHASVRLVDGRGVWGVQLDRPGSALNRYPTPRWQPGQIVVDDEDVNLNPATPPGHYRLEVRLLAANGQPIPSSGTTLLPGSVTITAQ